MDPKTLFTSPYDQKAFTKLLKGLLWDKYQDEGRYETKEIWQGFEYLTHYSRLGDIELDNGWYKEQVLVLEITQKSINDARVSITKETIKLLKKDIFQWYYTVLVAFRSDANPNNWRFSLIKSNDGKSWNNARRFSYKLWLGEWHKTPKQYLVDKGTIKNLKDLIDRFDVEVVRKEFFNLYISLFLELYQEVLRHKTDLQKNTTGWVIDLVIFTKNLMGKMIFLYFIQKKGWLWLSANENFDDHPFPWDPKFFANNFHKLAHDENLFQDKRNFYNDFLEPLFYSWLNEKREDFCEEKWKNILYWHKNLWMKVPYLNGWLFEEEYSNWQDTRIDLDNELFDTIIKSFDTYNFTIDENDPMDQEIAVDPEMLGKIFENMISINSKNIDQIIELYKAKKKFPWYPNPENIIRVDIWKEVNKQLWAFYTPREIVKYMCKESVIAYLVGICSDKNNKSEIEEKIRLLFEYKDKHYTTEEIQTEKWTVYNSLKSLVFDIIDWLKNVKVLDPAIGSWAFPMWILHEITTTINYLCVVFWCDFIIEDKDCRNDLYQIKKYIIENTIHGVDIDHWAIDIARLRFWLSLIVDAKEPSALPNFEFKFICANTLVPLETKDGEDLFKKNTLNIETIKRYFREYYRVDDHAEKIRIQERIQKYLWVWKYKKGNLFWNKIFTEQDVQLMSWDPFDSGANSSLFFDPKLMFGTDKFNIVIWNPPWDKVKAQDPKFFAQYDAKYREYGKKEQEQKRMELLEHWEIKKEYEDYIEYSIKMSKNINTYYKLQWWSDANLFKVFYELALNLSSDIVSFLIPGSITVDEGSTLMRQHLINNWYLKSIVWYTNKKELFEGIDNNQKFVSILTDKKWSQKVNILWWIDKAENIEENLITLPTSFYKEFDEYNTLYLDNDKEKFRIYQKLLNNPNTKSIKSLYNHFWREFDVTNDAKYFNDQQWIYKLFSGKCINIYDAMQKSRIEKHWRSARFDTLWYPKNSDYRTEYFVSEIPERIIIHHKKDNSSYRIVTQTVTGSVNNMRTIYSSLLHKKHLTNNSLNNLFLWKSDEENIFYLACISSFIVDWQARLKTATNLNKFIIETFLLIDFQSANPTISKKIIENTIKLVAVCEDYDELVQDILWKQSHKEVLCVDERDRQLLKNENDALIAKLFWIEKSELELILSTFPIVDDTIKKWVLEEFDKINLG